MSLRLADVAARAVASIAAVVLLVLLVPAWAMRLPYRYDLEWMEGGMLGHAWRLDQGLPLYGPPSLDFTPFVYPPGYAAVVAALGSVFSLSPTLGRVVSLVGTLAAASAIVHVGRRHGGSLALAGLAGVAWLGTWQGGGAFFDLCRPDGLYLGLLAWSIALAADDRRGADVASGLLLCAAFMIKHPAAAIGPALAIALLVRGGVRPALRFTAASALPALAFVGWLQLRTEGRFLEYLLLVPTSHPKSGRVFPLLGAELGTALPIACAVVTVWVVGRFVERCPWPVAPTAGLPVVAGVVAGWGATYVRPGPGLLVVPSGVGWFAIGALLMVAVLTVAGALARGLGREAWPTLSWREVLGGGVLLTSLPLAAAMRAHNGGYVNVVLPVFLVVCMGFAVVLGRIARDGFPGTAMLLAAAQLGYASATLDRGPLVPSPADSAAGDRVVSRIGAIEGEVFSPIASWMTVYAGRPPSAHHMALWDLDYPGGPFVEELGPIREQIAAGRFALVVDSTKMSVGFGVPERYREEGQFVAEDDRALRPKTGWRARPDRAMVPN